MKTSEELKKLKTYIPVRTNMNKEVEAICNLIKKLQPEINSEADAKLWWEGAIERLSFYYPPNTLSTDLKETMHIILNNLAAAERVMGSVPNMKNEDINNMIGKYFVLMTYDHALWYIKRYDRRLHNNFILNTIKESKDETL